MNIFEFRDQLIQSYQAFSRSFTKINSPDIRGEVERECFDKKRFWPDPLLQINPCYKTGKTTKELADAGKLHPTCGDIFLDREGNPLRLYKHQEQAVDLASKGSSYVVTTGTGSGKSMTFFIPIVDRILREKEAERLADGIVKPRTRAIVLYPMNALANSQFEEIEKYLKNAPDCGVTVGRYTGQDDTKKREALKANPPDILLTNYMMLELVLMRAGDRDLVRCAEGLEFLVLDELHTYRGRQGSDVAMLVRRLRSQLKTEALICVGTSATMASGESRDKQNEVVAGFATKIFGTRIPSEHVIAETLDRVTDARHVDQRPVLERAVRDAAKGQINLRDYEAFRKHPLAKWIEKELSVTPNLMRAEPKSLEDVAHALSKATSEPEEVTMRAVRNFLACFGNDDSVRTPDRRNPFPFKLHQFLSGPGKVYVTLEAPGTRIVTLDGQAYSQRGEETVRLYEAHFCLECGEEYIPVFATMGADGSVLSVSPRDIDEEAAPDQEDGNVVIGYLTPVRQDQRYQGNPEELPEDWLEESKRGELRVKRERRATVPKRVTLNASGLPDKAGADFWFMRGKFRFCVNCYRTASANGKDKNRLIGLSGEGRSSATSMLTLEMLELLYRSAEVNPERDIRKMLGFVDNRQDAALQAGHFNDFINQLILRGSLVGVLQNATGTFTLTALVDEIMRTFRFDDIYNQASLNEYLCNPANANGNLLQNALSIVRFGISYRLLLDLEDQNLYRSPSLERLGLLEIAYRDLEAFCGDDAYFKVNATLLALTAQDRFTLLKTFLDEMRRRRCIASRYLNPVEQDAMNAKDLGLVSARWSIFANRRSDQLRTGKFYAFDQRLAKDKRYANLGFVITERTQVVRRIAKQPLWKRALGHGMEPREACDVVRGIGEVLLKMGIVRATAIKNGDTFQIDESAILWGRPAEGAKVQNEFYRNLYFQTAALLQSNPETLFAFEGQEHTAQVSSEEREILEMRFRAEKDDRKAWSEQERGLFKRLPVLYCSPTMELGIDISALNFVFMRNVPPTPANYVQRAGRAGRSGQQALSLTYCASGSPHDQWFFNRPGDMVQGIVKEPTLDLTNEALVRAHLHSAWMTAAAVDLDPCIVNVLDMSAPDLPLLPELKEKIQQANVFERAVRLGRAVILQIESELKDESWYSEGFVERVMMGAPEDFDRAFDAWRTLYKSTLNQMEEATRVLTRVNTKEEGKNAKARLNEALAQKNILTGTGSKSSRNDFYSYRYLASQGFLPGYNFPAMPMVAWIPSVQGVEDEPTVLSRARFLGISEFGPNNHIYHRGRIFRITRIKIDATQGGGTAGAKLPTKAAVVCPNCGYAHLINSDRVCNQCENCGGKLSAEDAISGLYQVSMVETKEVERITVEDENRMNQGYEMLTLYRFNALSSGRPNRSIAEVRVDGAPIATLAYAPAATLWRVNLGWVGRRNKNSKGYLINPLTGDWAKQTTDSDPSASETPVKTDADGKPVTKIEGVDDLRQLIVPFVSDTRNILILTPVLDESPDPARTMATIQSALKRALEQFYQIESSELFVEPLPSKKDRRSLLIYESGEGGSGILHHLSTDKDALRKVAAQALELMHYELPDGADWRTADFESDIIDKKTSCVSGCYECLLTYYNQPDHPLIDRRDPAALRFLAGLASGAQTVVTGASVAPETPPVTGGSAWDRFKSLLAGRGCVLPDKERHTFKRLGLTVDGVYSAHRTVLSTEPLSEEDQESLKEVAFDLIDISDESSWPAVIDAHPEIFGGSAH